MERMMDGIHQMVKFFLAEEIMHYYVAEAEPGQDEK